MILGQVMARDIGGISKVSWLSSGVSIVNMSFGPAFSQAADYWGRKWFIVASCSIGMVGAIIVSRAQSMNIAILGTTLASMVLAAQPLTFTVASEILPRRYRVLGQAFVNLGLASGGVLALLGGNALAEAFGEGWRIIWYMETGFLAFAATVTTFMYNPPQRPEEVSLTTRAKLGMLDWTAIISLTIGVVLFVMGLTWANNPYPWRDAHVLGPFLIGSAILIALVIHQTKLKKDGLFHHGAFKSDRNLAIALICVGIEGLVYFVANVYYPMEVAILFTSDANQIALHWSVSLFSMFFALAVIVWYIPTKRDMRTPLVISYVFVALFFGLLLAVEPGKTALMWVAPIFVGLGTGIGYTVCVVVAHFGAPQEFLSLASGMIICIRAFGASIGVPIFVSMFNSQTTKYLPRYIANAVLPLGLAPKDLPAFIQALLSSDSKSLMQIPGVSPDVIAAGVSGLQQGYIKSFQAPHITAIILAVVGLIASCFVINPKAAFNMHVDSPLVENKVAPTKEAAASA
ncbi:hypothetical protein LTR84_005815 [Exophiala bonariae]|uniref:Major facilitator superfamily (MFS) profile domain-containing protein n=1 Tax=Exophiala bonariae TaxID=1690606 RepID=A0AAV9N3E3_9EURO|nr:hypothetical protein LTR84_005815 [Exophiala bonariae]